MRTGKWGSGFGRKLVSVTASAALAFSMCAGGIVQSIQPAQADDVPASAQTGSVLDDNYVVDFA